MVALLAMTWNALVWLIPLMRGLLNWRVAILAGIHDHSYLLRLFWQTQLLLIVIVTALILPFVVLIRTVCGAFPLL
jgi:hypothetical protein